MKEKQTGLFHGESLHSEVDYDMEFKHADTYNTVLLEKNRTFWIFLILFWVCKRNNSKTKEIKFLSKEWNVQQWCKETINGLKRKIVG